MNSPHVSVIIPVRNGKDYLQEALDSVLQQSFTDLELLLINDGSTTTTTATPFRTNASGCSTSQALAFRGLATWAWRSRVAS
jgi:GT2 family glycosyltransferase